MRSKQSVTIKINLTENLEDAGYIFNTRVILDRSCIFVNQNVRNDNVLSGESTQRIDLTSITQLDELIAILQMARTQYE